MTPKEVVAFAKENKARFLDLKFMDFPGMWHHFTVPVSEFSEESFEKGFGIDGSSIRGWKTIHTSDMLVIPDPETAVMEPFAADPTLTMICNIIDPITKESYTRDPRNIAMKAEAYLKSTKIGDISYFGPEPEFFIFDDIRYDTNVHSSYHFVDTKEGIWNSGREENPNLGYKPRHREGHYPVPPTDHLHDIRCEMVRVMESVGLRIEKEHHEVATGGQAEIDMRFDSLTRMGDKLMWFKYIVKNVALRHNKTATFMPKPLFGDNGSGMHTHQSIWKGNKNLFAGNRYGGLSDLALHYLGGILRHGQALCAIVAPSTNSYRRLVPGYEAPVNLAYSSRNRSAGIRIPMYSPEPSAKRIEVRFPDPASNGYMAFAAMLMAGLDGIEKRIDPGEPLDKNIYSLSPEELKDVPTVPRSFEEALRALEQDQEFLLKGDVFSTDAINKWIDYKKKNEIDPIRLRPVPYEFTLYYDV